MLKTSYILYMSKFITGEKNIYIYIILPSRKKILKISYIPKIRKRFIAMNII